MRDALLIVLVCGAITQALRFLPFLAFGGRTPAWVLYLGRVLPYAVMAMLVVYCLRETSLTEMPFGFPEIAASLTVVGLHAWKRNTLLSILTGTIIYMILIRVI